MWFISKQRGYRMNADKIFRVVVLSPEDNYSIRRRITDCWSCLLCVGRTISWDVIEAAVVWQFIDSLRLRWKKIRYHSFDARDNMYLVVRQKSRIASLVAFALGKTNRNGVLSSAYRYGSMTPVSWSAPRHQQFWAYINFPVTVSLIDRTFWLRQGAADTGKWYRP